MAHVAKYPASASGHMCNHYGRSEDMERSAYVVRGNESIDPERTHLNYNLAPDHGMSQLDFIHQRLSEVRVHKRTDVNVMCDWVVTLPKEITNMRTDIHMTPNQDLVSRLFFERSYEFLANRYGEKNVISAYVHRDETSDHMHFAFVPVTEDKKRGGEKLSAKEVITRADLRTFHEDLERHLDSFHDWHFEVLNDATKEGNKSIAELKRGTAVEELQLQQQAAADQIQQLHQQLHQQVAQEQAAADRRKEAIKKEIVELERKKEGILTSMEAKELEGKKTLTGGLKGVTFSEFEQLKRTAEKVDEMTIELAQANARADTADQRVAAAYADATSQLKALRAQDMAELKAARHDLYMEFDKKTSNMSWELQRLRRDNEILSGKVKRLEQAVDYLKGIIREKLPEMLKSVESRVKQLMNRTQGRGYGE